VKARQAGIGSKCCERDIGFAIRTQALDGAAQNFWIEPAHDRVERGRRAGVRRQKARGQQIRQLLPEQGIQRRVTL